MAVGEGSRISSYDPALFEGNKSILKGERIKMMDFIVIIVGLLIFAVAAVVAAGWLSKSAQRQGEQMAAQLIESHAAVDSKLNEIAQSIRDLPYEVSIFIDQSGGIVFQQTQYDSKAVHFSDVQINYLENHPRHINIHNHDTDTPPSVQDLLFSARIKAAYFVVVSPHYTYTVYPHPVSGWASHAELEAAVTKYEYLLHPVGQEKHFVGTDSDGAFMFEEVTEYECTDAAIESITQHLGYHYTRQPAA